MMTQQEQFEADYLAAFPHATYLEFAKKVKESGEYYYSVTRQAFAVWLQQAKRHEAEQQSVNDDHKRLVRELDVIWNGSDGAATQASLCDLVAQIRRDTGEMKRNLVTVLAAAPSPEPQQHKQSCASLNTLLMSNPPQRAKCDCGACDRKDAIIKQMADTITELQRDNLK